MLGVSGTGLYGELRDITYSIRGAEYELEHGAETGMGPRKKKQIQEFVSRQKALRKELRAKIEIVKKNPRIKQLLERIESCRHDLAYRSKEIHATAHEQLVHCQQELKALCESLQINAEMFKNYLE